VSDARTAPIHGRWGRARKRSLDMVRSSAGIAAQPAVRASLRPPVLAALTLGCAGAGASLDASGTATRRRTESQRH